MFRRRRRPSGSSSLHEVADAEVMQGLGRKHPAARLVSVVALALVGLALFYAARAAYYLATDVQVAPLLLTPDSDAVTASHLSLTGLMNDQEATVARIEMLEQSLQAAHASIARLRELQERIENGVELADALASEDEHASRKDLKKLSEEKLVLDQAVTGQAKYIEIVRARVQAGIAHESDLIREEAELRHLRLLQLQREREQVATEHRSRELTLARAAQPEAAHRGTPEVARQQEQLLRLEVELLNLVADANGKQAELSAAHNQADRLQNLISHLKARPMYRAVAQRQALAFVPYTQAAGIGANAEVFECRTWSVFDCEQVGRIAEVLPGEVATVDPWGAPARGQYAVLDLKVPSAVNAKVLRVRPAPERVDANVRNAHMSDTSALTARP